MEASLDVGAGSVPGEIGPHSDAARVDETRTESPAQDAGAAGTLSMVVDVPAPTPTPPTPTPGAKKMRNSKPKRVELDLQPGEDVSVTRTPVDDHAGRRNKPGVCYHKPSNKWRAIVYMQRKQVNLGYFSSREESEAQVTLARTYGLPKSFVNLRALRQPKRSGFPGVNWDAHVGKWLARVYLPSEGGKKGKEIKVDYFDDQREAWEACKRERVKHGLPETARPVKVAGADAGAGAAESAAPALPPGGGAADASPPDASDTDAGEEEHR
jgi:hypothetical protein